ncbi:MAG: hypothetical protein EBZ48_12575, partial [Proteobacteria bacterium]|nr:hypothetical protein [Pseudomonadota bacterium]
MVAATQNKLLSNDKAAEQAQNGGATNLAAPKAREFLNNGNGNNTEEASRIRALLNTKEATEQTSARQHTASRPSREKQHNTKQHQHVQEERSSHDRSDRIAFRQLAGSIQIQKPLQAVPRPGSRPGAQTGLTDGDKEHLH